jgi:hypothetical protein
MATILIAACAVYPHPAPNLEALIDALETTADE